RNSAHFPGVQNLTSRHLDRTLPPRRAAHFAGDEVVCHFSLITSPPARVNIAQTLIGAIDFRLNRTDPSPIAAGDPSPWCPSSPAGGPFESITRAAGLVQITARSSSASTRAIVFDVPSVICEILTPFGPSQMNPGPSGAR